MNKKEFQTRITDLVAMRILKKKEISAVCEISRPTVYKRLLFGNWRADEIEKLSNHLGISVEL